MPLQKFLENTLHGKCRLFITRCTLSKIVGEQESGRSRDLKGRGVVTNGAKARPEFLPPPTEVPLRYCKHNDEDTVVNEVDCLIDLLAGQPKGNEQPKNKQHFVLATADPSDAEKRKLGRAFADLREAARNVPGVPIVYVKRSVMVLEELSGASKRVKGGLERERLKEGLVGVGGTARKRKRSEEDGERDGEGEGLVGLQDAGARAKRRVVMKAKGPNPLSVKKKKPKSQVLPQREEDAVGATGGNHTMSEELPDDVALPKAKRRRKHKGKKGDEHESSEAATQHGMPAVSHAP